MQMYRLSGFLKWLAGSLLAIAVLTGLIFLQNPKAKVNSIPLPGPLGNLSATPEASHIQNLLVEITDSKQQFVVGSLLLNTGDKSVLAPLDPNVVVDLRVFGLRDLHGATNQTSSGQILEAFNVGSGMSIDGILNLSQIGLGGLLDDIGGVSVNVPEELTLPRASNDEPQTLPVGRVKLDGATAAAYAIYRRPGESVTEQSARFLPVLTAALDSLPKNAQAINSRLASLGQSGTSNLTDLEIANYLARTSGTWSKATTLRISTEPSQLRPKSKPNWLWLNPTNLYSDLLRVQPQALWLSDPNKLRITVSSVNPSGRLAVRQHLSRGNLYFVDGGGTSPSLKSHLLATDTVPSEVLDQIKADLNLPDLDIQVVSQISTGTELQLDLGMDFNDQQFSGRN
ncbi:MAG: hypothetical protein KGQ38_06535 [Actinomycetales bacterium]|nr:hypothetical protein [Actinomycetales bacterium]